jgi:hypothetical protein
MAVGNSGVARKRAQLGTDQEQEERDRHIPGFNSGEPEENEDGSADVPIPEDDDSLTELPDGSVEVKLEEEEDEPADEDFYENLAERLDDSVLSRLSSDLLESVERDREARKKRDEQYAEGIKRTGLGNEAPGGAQFDGASRAVHPVLVEACIDFAARAIKELLPAEGPVKTKIIGEQSEPKLQKAERKRQFMNWQLTSDSPRAIREYRREMEVALTQLPLGGSQYVKFWRDERWKRTRCEFVPIDDLLLPFEATDLASATRKTHVQKINRATFEERVASGMYREIPVGEPVLGAEETAAEQASAKIEGVDDLSYNEDGLRVIYESQILLSIEDDKYASHPVMSYILTVDEPSGQVLSLRRNWEQDDELGCPLDWMVELPFIPWRGAYAIGLAHIIGSLSGATTGALRSLLDSALMNNTATGFILEGGRMSGQNTQAQVGELAQVKGPVNIDDIRKLIMPNPFNPPSETLFSLLQWLTEQAKGVVATATEKIADATSQMPVGTALALIEQGSITFSSIHTRLHDAQKKALAIIHRLNAKYLEDEETVEELGELVVSRADFEGPMDVEPVSDPNIFSDAQRYAQNQALLQLKESAPPGLFKDDEVYRRTLRTLRIPDPDALLNAPKEPQKLDAVSENKQSADPQTTLKAYSGQDHLSHLKCHVAFMTSPMLGANPLIGAQSLPKLLAHCNEHILALYEMHAKAAQSAAAAIPGAQTGDAEALAEQQLAQMLGPLMQHLQQAQQMAQQFTQQPQDPKVQAAQIKAKSDQQIAAAETAKEQAQAAATQAAEQRMAQSDAADHQLAANQQQIDAANAEKDRRLEQWETSVEMQTARANAEAAALQAHLDRALKAHIEDSNKRQEDYMARLNGQIEAVLTALKAQLAPQPAEQEVRNIPEGNDDEQGNQPAQEAGDGGNPGQ